MKEISRKAAGTRRERTTRGVLILFFLRYGASINRLLAVYGHSSVLNIKASAFFFAAGAHRDRQTQTIPFFLV